MARGSEWLQWMNACLILIIARSSVCNYRNIQVRQIFTAIGMSFSRWIRPHRTSGKGMSLMVAIDRNRSALVKLRHRFSCTLCLHFRLGFISHFRLGLSLRFVISSDSNRLACWRVIYSNRLACKLIRNRHVISHSKIKANGALKKI